MFTIEAEFTEPTNSQSTVALLRSCDPIGPFYVNFTITIGNSNDNNRWWLTSAKAEVASSNFAAVLRNRQAQEVVGICVDTLSLDLGEVSITNVGGSHA